MSRDMCRHAYDRREGPCPECDPVKWSSERIAALESQLAAVEKERDEATGALAAARGAIELLVQAVDTERSLRGWSTGAQVDALTSPALIHAAAFLFSSAADLAARHDAEIERRALEKAAHFIMEASVAWEAVHELTEDEVSRESAAAIRDVAHDFVANFGLDMAAIATPEKPHG